MVSNTRPPPSLKPAPPANPPRVAVHASFENCRNCGSSETRRKGDGSTVCAFCRGTRVASPASHLIEVTTVGDSKPRFLAMAGAVLGALFGQHQVGFALGSKVDSSVRARTTGDTGPR